MASPPSDPSDEELIAKFTDKEREFYDWAMENKDADENPRIPI